MITPNKHFEPAGSELFLQNLKNIPKSMLSIKHMKINHEITPITQKQKYNEPPPCVPVSKKIRGEINEKQEEKQEEKQTDIKSNKWKELWQPI